MRTKDLFRLFFAERYGIKVVIPSMRETAAWVALWDDSVRKELTKREPETLVSYGDPGALDLRSRGKLITQFVTVGNSRELDLGRESFIHVFLAALRRGVRKRTHWVALIPNIWRFADPKVSKIDTPFIKEKTRKQSSSGGCCSSWFG